MSDIIHSVKEEILRLADKQAAAQVGKARKAAIKYRSEAAALKRLLQRREKEIKRLKKQLQTEQVQPEDVQLEGVRYSAKSVRSQRRRLGLTCEQYANLVGVSPLSVSNWESGKARPRKAQLARLVAVRGIPAKEAMRRLAKLS